MSEQQKMPGTGGDVYIPREARTGKEAIVFFTRDLFYDYAQKIRELGYETFDLS